MSNGISAPAIRTGQGAEHLDFEQFRHRFVSRFFDPNFRAQQDAIESLAKTAWENYQQSRKSPITRKAGAGDSDPDYDAAIFVLQHPGVPSHDIRDYR